MSADTHSGAIAGGAASEATLIATLYGHSGADEPIARLCERLQPSLPKPPEAFLECFDPPGRAAHDTSAIQLALNVPGEAAKAWQEARQMLEGILLPNDAAVEGIWGYTLVYQAELNEGVDPDSALKELLPAIRRLHSPDDLYPLDSLAQVEVSGGRLWLLAIPVEGEGLEAATLYAALSPPKEAQALLDVFYGPTAMLLEPDLIAHKGYHQMRQYRGDHLEEKYDESADSLRNTTSELLGGLSRDPAQTDKLTELARKYQLLFPVVAKLSELHTALAKQQLNYESSSKTRTRGGEIVEYHHEQLEMATLGLNLGIEELRHALEAADKAVSMAQVKVEEAQEGRQLRIEAVLAAAGVALALPHLLEPETISALLGLLLDIEVPHMENGLLTESGHLMVLVTQVAIIGPMAYLTYRLVTRGSLHKLRGFYKWVSR